MVIQGLAEIVKHFQISVTSFSPRVSWHTGVLTNVVTFEISRHGVLGSYRMCVCAVELFLWTGSVTETQRGFHHEMNRHEAPSPNALCR
jgi:hypothetical protein